MKSSLLNISTKLKSEMFSHVLFFKMIVIPSPPFRGDAGEVQRPFFDIFFSHHVTHEREISVDLPGRRFATPTDRFTVINCFGTSYSMMTSSSTKYTTSAMHHVFLEGAA